MYPDELEDFFYETLDRAFFTVADDGSVEQVCVRKKNGAEKREEIEEREERREKREERKGVTSEGEE